MSSGHRPILGHADETYWNKLNQHHGFPKPPAGSDSLGFNLFGDEGQIFDHVEHMCLNWASELSPFHTNSRYSRFLIGMVPATMFWKTDTKMNVTLNELLRVVIQSFQILEEGFAGVSGQLVAFKGDWKFLVQSLHLCPQPSKDHICWSCGATKSMVCPYTDMSPGALWKRTPPVNPLYEMEPALSNLRTFPIIALDAMHMFHLGVGRDLAASTILLLLRSTFFAGGKACNCVSWLVPFSFFFLQVEDRMKDATAKIKAWVKANLKDKRLPKWWKLSKSRLSLKTNKYVHLTGKAWHTAVVIQYLANLFSVQDVHQVEADVKLACWTANQFFHLLTDCRKESVWLEPDQASQAQILGESFLKTYVGLHNKYHGRSNFKLFNCRPKLHLMAHMVANFENSPRNPLMDAVWMDENWIGQVLKLARKTHCRRTHVSTLLRYTAGPC